MGTDDREPEADPYATAVHRWWHLSQPSPELLAALDAGWIVAPGRVLDLGCGLGIEIGFLARRGFAGVGTDLSEAALRLARVRHAGATFVLADLRALPFPDESFDVLLDRGTFHYLPAGERSRYEEDARRVLRPGGRLLLRACLTTAGVRNDVDDDVLRRTFAAWRFVSLDRVEISSDTRRMPSLIARLERL